MTMEDTKDAKPQPADSTTGRTRDEQATSSKTLADLEETQADAGVGKSGASETSSPTEGSSPSPDGGADGARGGRADGGDTGGPM